MPDFYQHGGFPVTRSAARSAQMRAELLKIQEAMAKLAQYTGNANKFVIINPDGTSYTTTSTLLASQIPALDVSKINAGTFATARIPNLDAAKITTGEFVAARIPNLPASKVTGTLTAGQVPNLSPAKINPKATISRSANYAVTSNDRNASVLVDASGGDRTVTLPNLGNGDDGFTVQIMKTDESANAVTLDGNGNDTINGEPTQDLTAQYQAVTLEWDGSDWFMFAGGGQVVNQATNQRSTALLLTAVFQNALSVTITPSAAGAVVELVVTLFSSDASYEYRILRGSTELVPEENAGTVDADVGAFEPLVLRIYDNPNSASAVTYHVQAKSAFTVNIEMGANVLAREIPSDNAAVVRLASDLAVTTGAEQAALSVSMTPSSASAKIRLSFAVFWDGSGNAVFNYRVYRGSIALMPQQAERGGPDDIGQDPIAFDLYDEPNTTSAVTYEFRVLRGAGTGSLIAEAGSVMLAEELPS